jgi:alkaline phosphatase D
MDRDSIDDARLDLDELESSPGLGRRAFLIGGLATGAALSAPVNYAALARNRRLPLAKHVKFPQGIASGFPYPRGTILWTRAEGLKKSAKLKLAVAKDRHFKNTVLEKTVTARSDRDFTARARVNGLRPDHEYFYRFFTEHSHSEVGRFRTGPPLDSKRPLKIAYYSCQEYQPGFYNAQAAIANEQDVDLVLCLGDCISESGYTKGVRTDGTGINHDGHVETLPEYWQKYRLYKSDPDLKRMHAAHNFIGVWDDHEVEDNYADGGPSPHAQSGMTNDDFPRRVPFPEREQNGYQARFNYMPVLRFEGDRTRIYDSLQMGALVNLLITDQRQYRDAQPCNDKIIQPCPEEDGDRSMLGAKQKTWFKSALQSSRATWKIWGSEVMLMGFGSAPGPNHGIINDGWDGYQKERKELLDFILDANIQNVVALTGDIHTFFAGTAGTTGDTVLGRPAVPEFVGGSATSPGLPEESGVDPSVFNNVAALNPHFQFTDFTHRGFGIVNVSATELTCELRRVQIQTRDRGAYGPLAKFRVPLGSRSPQKIA